MGEAKRRKKLDPNFGKIPQKRGQAKLDFKLFKKFMDLPSSFYSKPENATLVEQGLEQFMLMAEQAGVQIPSLPTDPEERQRLLEKFKQGIANTKLELPDGSLFQ